MTPSRMRLLISGWALVIIAITTPDLPAALRFASAGFGFWHLWREQRMPE